MAGPVVFTFGGPPTDPPTGPPSGPPSGPPFGFGPPFGPPPGPEPDPNPAQEDSDSEAQVAFCVICWEDLFSKGEERLAKKARVVPEAEKMDACVAPCGHCFHKKCLCDWFKKNNADAKNNKGTRMGSCPKCRKNIEMKKLYPISLIFPGDHSSSENEDAVGPPVFQWPNAPDGNHDAHPEFVEGCHVA